MVEVSAIKMFLSHHLGPNGRIKSGDYYPKTQAANAAKVSLWKNNIKNKPRMWRQA
jgi:hypothetical protein